jgi:uncharacterized protein (DUF1810 family)
VPDPFDLERFVSAQDDGDTYTRALAELRSGRKETHWMWFVFPQLAGLGSSPMARRFAIRSSEEARAYLAHPVLGARLLDSARAFTAAGESAEAALGGVDALKLRSSMTLFVSVAGDAAARAVFQTVLDRFFDGTTDPVTERLLS